MLEQTGSESAVYSILLSALQLAHRQQLGLPPPSELITREYYRSNSLKWKPHEKTAYVFLMWTILQIEMHSDLKKMSSGQRRMGGGG